MSKRFKIAYIGAGSFRFSIGLFRNIINATQLFPLEISLCDIDEFSLNLMKKVLEKMVIKGSVKKGYNPTDILISASIDRRVVLENADIVFKSISVGLQASEWFDIYLPLKFGIPQNTGDTVGPGGLFRGLRTCPPTADIVRDMKELCPKAPLLNYTNPQASLVLAAHLAAPNIQVLGLCHELFGGLKSIQRGINAKLNITVKNRSNLDVEYTGVNHFAWFTKIEYNNQDLYPLIHKNIDALIKKRFYGWDCANSFNYYLTKIYGYFPYPGARHVAEFLPDYYNYFNHDYKFKYWKFPIIRSVRRVEKERYWSYYFFNLIAQGRFPAPVPRKEGELAVEMTLDWKNDVNTPYIVNIPNQGIVPELPEKSIVEIPGFFKNGVITPIKMIHLPSSLIPLIKPHCEVQLLTAEAALGNSFDLILKAMLKDPMNQWIEDDDKIEYMTKLLLFYEQKWLSQSWSEWIPSENELKSSKYWISLKDLAREQNKFMEKKFSVKESLRTKAFFGF